LESYLVIVILLQHQVLFLGCADLRNVLLTSSKLTDAYKKLDAHFSADSEFLVARSVMIAHIILSDDFHPENSDDLQYLWDVAYSLQWNEHTKKRFIKNIKQLLAGQWSSKIILPASDDIECLKDFAREWLNKGCNIPTKCANGLVQERYINITMQCLIFLYKDFKLNFEN
jgi:hypothetical protein